MVFAFNIVSMFEQPIVRIMLHAWLITILGVLIAGIFSGNPDMYNLAFLAMGVTFSAVVFLKGREFGFDTTRGKFLLIAAPVGIIIGLAVLLNNPFLHILFRLLMLAALVFMFLNLRIKMKIRFRSSHLIIPGLFGILIIFLIFILMHEAPLNNWFTLTIAGIDVLSLVMIVLNLTLYLGGEIAREWLFRTVSIMVLIVGDILYLLDMAGKLNLHLELLLWFLPFFVMSNVLIYTE